MLPTSKREIWVEMRIKYHYCLENKFGLTKFLEKFQISYEICEFPEIKYKSCSFDLYEDQKAYEMFKMQFPFVSRLECIRSIEYSRADIENAEWLSVRNISTKVQWEYDEKAFERSCPYKRPFFRDVYYRHTEQKDILSATKPVKWGTRQFFSGPNAADNLIFCSERAKKILGNQWKGLEFLPVKKYNTSKYIDDLYQLFFTERLPVEIIRGEQQTICKSCGRRIIRIPKGESQLKLDGKSIQDQKSVYKTGEVLTEELIRNTTFSLNIVPQDFYQYCEKHAMNRGMVYEPIHLL